MKSSMFSRSILKLSSDDIIKNKNNYEISIEDAKLNMLTIEISDSMVIRWIDEIRGFDRIKKMSEYTEIHKSLNKLKKEKNVNSVKKKIKELYQKLQDMQYFSSLINIVMKRDSDIDKLNKGFTVNGVSYKRLIATPNQAKKRTVTYIDASVYDIIYERIENGRDKKVKLVPGKYEAYKALTLSGSFPVTNTENILVVDDLITKFREDVILLDDSNAGEPAYKEENIELELDESDGYGLISPKLAQIWSNDIGIDYLMSGCCIRNSFTKGMVATFDFHEFAKVNNKQVVKDVWGKEHNINDIDIVLTTSMLKLWSSYDSLESYIENCNKNKYSFSITKVAPKKLDEVRTLNYQFIQSYDLSDEDIRDLYEPTVNEIKDILHGDINKTILFLKGVKVTEDNIDINNNDWIKALMIDDRMMNDPFVIDRINTLIKKKIQDSKIGKLKVNGNFGIIVGDPYALCQKIFELDVKNEDYGLLKAGEIYHKFWSNKKVEKVACFRAPMTSHENIRVMNIHNSNDADYWYRYCSNLMMLNCHDSFCHALNGCDKDGDIVFTSDNHILVNKWKYMKTIICPQKSAEKVEITDKLLVESNKLSFGSKVGAITNRVTSMFDLLPLFDKDSVEYNILTYRIKCGQLYQQNDIDATKGIVASQMPRYWYEKIKETESDSDVLNNKICVDKKPYFMIYIYPEQRKKYNTFISETKSKCLKLFGIDIETLMRSELDDEKAKFIEKYYRLMPINDNGSVMNRLCHMIEDEFKGYISGIKAKNPFDYTILKSDTEYDVNHYKIILQTYLEYMKELKKAVANNNSYKCSREEYSNSIKAINSVFAQRCAELCPNEDKLCNILVDICYTNNKSKALVWSICADQLIENLLKNNNYKMKYLTKSNDGDVIYNGELFQIEEIDFNDNNE